jgi:hypothetical protein
MLDMSSIRLIKFAQFVDNQDKLICSGIEGTFIFDFNYKSKYSPLLAVSVDSYGRYIKIDLRNQILIEIPWSKGLIVDEINQLIITWTNGRYKDKTNSEVIPDSKVNFSKLSFKTGDLVSDMSNLTDGEEVILDVKLFIDFRYFLTSTNFGNILVWKYQPNGKYDSNRRLIHNFSGHMQKPVTSIMPFKKSNHLFLSVSKDCTARIWSIQSFQHLYTFFLPGHIKFIEIMSGAAYVVVNA